MSKYHDVMAIIQGTIVRRGQEMAAVPAKDDNGVYTVADWHAEQPNLATNSWKVDRAELTRLAKVGNVCIRMTAAAGRRSDGGASLLGPENYKVIERRPGWGGSRGAGPAGGGVGGSASRSNASASRVKRWLSIRNSCRAAASRPSVRVPS
jgi:hypothetical protein